MAIIMITGGSRSGKSQFAESYCLNNYGKLAYVATAEIFDEEMSARVAVHRKRRGGEWDNFEIPYELQDHLSNLQSYEGILLDCLTMMVFNKMMRIETSYENLSADAISEIEDTVLKFVENSLSRMRDAAADFVVVTNEIGLGIVPADRLSRLYRDIVGKSNQMMAKFAKEVYFVVSGIPLKIKG